MLFILYQKQKSVVPFVLQCCNMCSVDRMDGSCRVLVPWRWSWRGKWRSLVRRGPASSSTPSSASPRPLRLCPRLWPRTLECEEPSSCPPCTLPTLRDTRTMALTLRYVHWQAKHERAWAPHSLSSPSLFFF